MTALSRPLVVLAGGPSVERDVSLRTGAAVAASLARSGHDVRTHDPPGTLDGFAFRPGETAVIALHGAYGEDGTVQDELAARGVPFTGAGATASRRAFDKWAAREACGLDLAEGSLDPAGWGRFPCVVKPRRGGSSYGLSLVRSADELQAAVAKAGEPLIEVFVEGEEWTVALLDGEPLTPVRVRAAGAVFDTHAKYADPASRFEPSAGDDSARDAALREAAATACGKIAAAGLCRADFIWDGRRPVFLELNTVPGMTERSLAPLSAAASGIAFDELVRRTLPACPAGE